MASPVERDLLCGVLLGPGTSSCRPGRPTRKILSLGRMFKELCRLDSTRRREVCTVFYDTLPRWISVFVLFGVFLVTILDHEYQGWSAGSVARAELRGPVPSARAPACALPSRTPGSTGCLPVGFLHLAVYPRFFAVLTAEAKSPFPSTVEKGRTAYELLRREADESSSASFGPVGSCWSEVLRQIHLLQQIPTEQACSNIGEASREYVALMRVKCLYARTGRTFPLPAQGCYLMPDEVPVPWLTTGAEPTERAKPSEPAEVSDGQPRHSDSEARNACTRLEEYLTLELRERGHATLLDAAEGAATEDIHSGDKLPVDSTDDEEGWRGALAERAGERKRRTLFRKLVKECEELRRKIVDGCQHAETMDFGTFALVREQINHVDNICFFLHSAEWQRRSDATVSRLALASGAVAARLQEQATNLHQMQKIQKEQLEGGWQVQQLLTNVQDGMQEVFSLLQQIRVFHKYLAEAVGGAQTLCFYFLALLLSFLFTAHSRLTGARLPLFLVLLVSGATELALRKWGPDVLYWRRTLTTGAGGSGSDSPRSARVLEDGKLHMTDRGGKSWTEVMEDVEACAAVLRYTYTLGAVGLWLYRALLHRTAEELLREEMRKLQKEMSAVRAALQHRTFATAMAADAAYAQACRLSPVLPQNSDTLRASCVDNQEGQPHQRLLHQLKLSEEMTTLRARSYRPCIAMGENMLPNTADWPSGLVEVPSGSEKRESNDCWGREVAGEGVGQEKMCGGFHSSGHFSSSDGIRKMQGQNDTSQALERTKVVDVPERQMAEAVASSLQKQVWDLKRKLYNQQRVHTRLMGFCEDTIQKLRRGERLTPEDMRQASVLQAQWNEVCGTAVVRNAAGFLCTPSASHPAAEGRAGVSSASSFSSISSLCEGEDPASTGSSWTSSPFFSSSFSLRSVASPLLGGVSEDRDETGSRTRARFFSMDSVSPTAKPSSEDSTRNGTSTRDCSPLQGMHASQEFESLECSEQDQQDSQYETLLGNRPLVSRGQDGSFSSCYDASLAEANPTTQVTFFSPVLSMRESDCAKRTSSFVSFISEESLNLIKGTRNGERGGDICMALAAGSSSGCWRLKGARGCTSSSKTGEAVVSWMKPAIPTWFPFTRRRHSGAGTADLSGAGAARPFNTREDVKFSRALDRDEGEERDPTYVPCLPKASRQERRSYLADQRIAVGDTNQPAEDKVSGPAKVTVASAVTEKPERKTGRNQAVSAPPAPHNEAGGAHDPRAAADAPCVSVSPCPPPSCTPLPSAPVEPAARRRNPPRAARPKGFKSVVDTQPPEEFFACLRDPSRRDGVCVSPRGCPGSSAGRRGRGVSSGSPASSFSLSHREDESTPRPEACKRGGCNTTCSTSDEFGTRSREDEEVPMRDEEGAQLGFLLPDPGTTRTESVDRLRHPDGRPTQLSTVSSPRSGKQNAEEDKVKKGTAAERKQKKTGLGQSDEKQANTERQVRKAVRNKEGQEGKQKATKGEKPRIQRDCSEVLETHPPGPREKEAPRRRRHFVPAVCTPASKS